MTESTRRNQASRARLVSEGALGRTTGGSLKVEDIDRWIRTVTPDPGTLQLLEAWRAEHAGEGVGCWRSGERPPSPDSINWWWRHAREAAGIPKHRCLHDLRHWSSPQRSAPVPM